MKREAYRISHAWTLYAWRHGCGSGFDLIAEDGTGIPGDAILNSGWGTELRFTYGPARGVMVPDSLRAACLDLCETHNIGPNRGKVA